MRHSGLDGPHLDGDIQQGQAEGPQGADLGSPYCYLFSQVIPGACAGNGCGLPSVWTDRNTGNRRRTFAVTA